VDVAGSAETVTDTREGMLGLLASHWLDPRGNQGLADVHRSSLCAHHEVIHLTDGSLIRGLPGSRARASETFST
jgi:hypothetical protein